MFWPPSRLPIRIPILIRPFPVPSWRPPLTPPKFFTKKFVLSELWAILGSSIEKVDLSGPCSQGQGAVPGGLRKLKICGVIKDNLAYPPFQFKWIRSNRSGKIVSWRPKTQIFYFFRFSLKYNHRNRFWLVIERVRLLSSLFVPLMLKACQNVLIH